MHEPKKERKKSLDSDYITVYFKKNLLRFII